MSYAKQYAKRDQLFTAEAPQVDLQDHVIKHNAIQRHQGLKSMLGKSMHSALVGMNGRRIIKMWKARPPDPQGLALQRYWKIKRMIPQYKRYLALTRKA